jgi:hypothetical protein
MSTPVAIWGDPELASAHTLSRPFKLERGLERPYERHSSRAREGQNLAVLFYGVVSDSTEEAVELFTSREEAEAIVLAWDRDEPDQVGALRVETLEFRTGTTN